LFKVSDGEAILKEVSSIAAVAPVSSQNIQAVFGNENWSTSVTGSDNEFFRVTNRSIRTGRQFSDSELRGGAAVCIMGETVCKKLFGGQTSLGGNIRLEKLSCQVIGILGAKGQNTMGMDQDDIVVIPLRTYQRRISGNQDVRCFRSRFSRVPRPIRLSRIFGC
jgi:putative ABC transport system permease protein